MGLVRMIVAIVVALSVASAPAVAGSLCAAGSAEPMQAQVVQAQVVSSAAEPDDCHHQSTPGNNSKAIGDCASMAACAAKCFNYAGTTLPSTAFPSRRAVLPPMMTADLVVLNIGHPPFRPPCV